MERQGGTATTGVLSWGNYPPFPQVLHRSGPGEGIDALLGRLTAAHGGTLAFGAGRTYGDACLALSGHALDMRPRRAIRATDWTRGIVVADAGATLGEIAAAAIPRGWFLPVTPGTKHVTLGGAIANDVHGKNHHARGTFGRHVRAIGLVRSDRGRIACSPTDSPELFAATIAGLGLTGIIERAEVALVPIRSSRIASTAERFGSLDDFFALSSELDPVHEFCVAWIDCAARGGAAGRGVYLAGDFAADGPLAVERSSRLDVPVLPPFSLVSGPVARWFNEAWFRLHPARRTPRITGYDRFFYPLDGIRRWNRIYGRRGFQQYQCIVPEPAAVPAVRALLDAISASGEGAVLGVLKRCGDLSSPGLLSFPRPGTTLALDFPHTRSLEERLLPRLDAIVREAGGRIYPAKDARMAGEDFRRAYPQWPRVEALRDPALCSRFWNRVTGAGR